MSFIRIQKHKSEVYFQHPLVIKPNKENMQVIVYWISGKVNSESVAKPGGYIYLSGHL